MKNSFVNFLMWVFQCEPLMPSLPFGCSEEDEEQDLDESVVFEINEPEEEDVERIKEESRRRRQAILDKCKNQHQLEEQQEQVAEPQPGNSEKGISIVKLDPGGSNVDLMAHYIM